MKIIITSCKLISKIWGGGEGGEGRTLTFLEGTAGKSNYQVALRREKFPDYSKNNEKIKMTVIFQGVDLARMSNLNQP